MICILCGCQSFLGDSKEKSQYNKIQRLIIINSDDDANEAWQTITRNCHKYWPNSWPRVIAEEQYSLNNIPQVRIYYSCEK